jgi:hypothetical protein
VQVRVVNLLFRLPKILVSSVDSEISQYLNLLLLTSVSMLTEFCSILLITPSFTPIGLVVAIAGKWLGNVYMKAQLSVKREMSNAKAPVLAQYVSVWLFPSAELMHL